MTRGSLPAALLIILATAFAIEASAEDSHAESFVEFTGTMVPAREAEITPLVSGWLNSINFAPGEYVSKGKVLFEFDRQPTKLMIRQAEATLAGTRALLKNAEAKLLRAQELLQRSVDSDAQFQEAEANRDLAAANVEQAERAVELLKIDLARLVHKAPFDGIMSEPLVMENGWQDVGGSGRDSFAMAIIAQIDPIRVVGELPYPIFAQLQERFGKDEAIAQNVLLEVILPDGAAFPHKGRLVSGGYRFDPQTQKLRVWGEFDNPDLSLRPGLQVTVRSWTDH